MLKMSNLFFLARRKPIYGVIALRCLQKTSLLAADLIPEAKGVRLVLTVKRHCSNMSGGRTFPRLSHKARKVPWMKTLPCKGEVWLCLSIVFWLVSPSGWREVTSLPALGRCENDNCMCTVRPKCCVPWER